MRFNAKEETKKVLEAYDDLMNDVMKTLDVDALGSCDPNTFTMLGKTFALYSLGKEYAIKYAEMIDDQNEKLEEMNKKLDKLIKEK